MSLYSLMAVNILDEKFQILENKRACKIENYKFNNDMVTINDGGIIKRGDIFIIKSVQFREVSDDFKFKTLYLCFDNQQIKMDSNMMRLIYESQHSKYQNELNINNEKIITFNIPAKELNIYNIFLLLLLNQNVSFKIEYIGKFNECYLQGHSVYYNLKERKQSKIILNSYNYYELIQYEFEQHTIEGEHNLNILNGIVNGIFISGLDISHITSLELLFDNKSIINLDQYILTNFINQISPTDFYLPFDYCLDFNRTSNLNYGVNCTAIQENFNTNIILKICTTKPNNFYVGFKKCIQATCGLGKMIIDNN